MVPNLPDDFASWPVEAQEAWLKNQRDAQINALIMSELRLEGPSGNSGGLTKMDKIRAITEIVN